MEEKRQEENLKNKNKSSWIRELIEVALIAFIVIKFITQVSLVVGACMNPLLIDGDRLFVNKFVYHFKKIRRGDIIVFQSPINPKYDFIKRVIGLPGEKIQIIDGYVYINGKKLNEPYVKYRDHFFMAPFNIPTGEFFVMGDNRPNSLDSRYWGTVKRDKVIGKAFFCFWPLKHFKWLDGGEKWGKYYFKDIKEVKKNEN